MVARRGRNSWFASGQRLDQQTGSCVRNCRLDELEMNRGGVKMEGAPAVERRGLGGRLVLIQRGVEVQCGCCRLLACQASDLAEAKRARAVKLGCWAAHQRQELC